MEGVGTYSREMSFLSDWGRRFALGDSWRGLVARLVAAVVLIGIVPGLPSVTITIFRDHLKPFSEVTVPLGLAVSVATLILWAGMTGAIAFMFSRGPHLSVAGELEEDTGAQCFRLRLWNKSRAACRAAVEIKSVKDDLGNSLLSPAQAPLELQ